MADIHPALTQNVHPLGFGARSHPPQALNFGFGMTNSSFTPSTLSTFSSVRSNKRRFEGESSDDGMDTRSPTPEELRRLPMKRLKGTAHSDASERLHNRSHKSTRTIIPLVETETDEIDVGFMLALLPPQTLVPLISSLVKENPSLKSSVLSLMPRPTLESALQALSQSSAKLKNAHPYSSPTCGFNHPTTFISHAVRSTSFRSVADASSSAPGMRDSYIQSRIAPHLAEFTTNIRSVLPFFSLIPSSELLRKSSQELKAHPSETFTYLSAVTREIISLPPICQATLRQTLVPRLVEEWKGWLHRVDDYVNNQAGMFGLVMLKSWESELDDFAEIPDTSSGLGALRQIRDAWVASLGRFVGRTPQNNRMDDEL